MTDVSAYGDIFVRDLALRNADLFNNTATDADLARLTYLNFIGTDSLSSQHSLVRIEASHDGTATDQKGRLGFGVNTGAEGSNPSEALIIDSTGLVDVVSNATVGGTLGVTGAATFTAESVHNGGLRSVGNIVHDSGAGVDNLIDIQTEGAAFGEIRFTNVDSSSQNFDIIHDRVNDTLQIAEYNGGDIANVANNGSGLIRITTVTTHGLSTDNTVVISDVVGTTEANGTFNITVIGSKTFDLVGSTFTNVYVSGGTWVRREGMTMNSDGDVTFSKDATVDGALGVTGAATFTAQSVHNGGVDVNGNADVSGTLAVTDVATFTAQTVHNGGVDVNGVGNVSDTLTLSKTSDTGLSVTANALVGGTLGVTGAATFTAESVHNGGLRSVGNIVHDSGAGVDNLIDIQTEGAAFGDIRFTDVDSSSRDFDIIHDRVNDTLQFTEYSSGGVGGAANNGSGLIRITSTAHGLSTDNTVVISDVVGTTEANGTFDITVIDANTFDLVGSTFTNVYTSGGTWVRQEGMTMNANGDVTFSEDATVDGALSVTGVATFTAQSVHNGGVDVNGNADVSGTLAVTDVATFTAQTVHNGGVDINGIGNVSDTLTLSKTSDTGLSVTANALVGGTLGVTGAATFTAQSVHNGGVDVNGNADVSGNLVVGGDMTVSGTTTFIDTTNLRAADKNIEMNYVDGTSETDVSANGGGLTLHGTTDKTLNWIDSTDAWTSSEHIDLASGKSLLTSGTELLTSTQIVLDSAGQAGLVYLGDPASNDTWRITVSGGNLVFQARVAGSYVTKFSIVK